MAEYKLELWRDKYNSTTQRWEEERVCSLGHSELTNIYDAFDIVYNVKINGEETLSFSLKGKYSTPDGLVDNYYTILITNESKIKLFFKDEWHDFIVKEISASHSNDITYSYVCESIAVRELSKIGYGIRFSLDDASGRAIRDAHSFMEEVASYSSWRYARAGQDYPAQDLYVDLQEYSKQISYEYSIVSGQSVKVYNIDSTTYTTHNSGYLFVPYSESERLITYRDTHEAIDDFVLCYYSASNNFTIDGNLIEKADLKRIKLSEVYPTGGTNKITYIAPSKYSIEVPEQTIQTEFIYLQGTTANNSISEYCEKVIYVNEEDEEISAYRRLVTYAKERGYEKPSESNPSFYAILDKDYDAGTTIYIAYPSTDGTIFKQITINVDIYSGEGLTFDAVADELYANRRLVAYLSTSATNPEFFISMSRKVYYLRTINSTGSVFYTAYYNLNGFPENMVDNFYESLIDSTNYAQYTPEIFSVYQYFSFDGTTIQEIGQGFQGNNYCYAPKENGDYIYDTINRKYVPAAAGTGNFAQIVTTPVTSSEMKRTIEIENSNCLNIFETIAQTFECWCKFIIIHDSDGRISLDENGIPQKYVTLVNRVGEELNYGLTFGINASNIVRNVISSDIITKLYVPDSESTLVANGVVSIALSDKNIGKENYLLDFSYFINNGAIDEETLSKDLYNRGANWQDKLTDLTQPIYINAPTDDKDDAPGFLIYLNAINARYDYLYSIGENSQISIINQISSLQAQIDTLSIRANTAGVKESDYLSISAELFSANEKLLGFQHSLEMNTSEINALIENKKRIESIFMDRYGQFIREGAWDNSGYIDNDTLYYDALKVLKNSGAPTAEYQIQYIDVAEIFKDDLYNIVIGDNLPLEDRELFGFEANGKPVQKKVLVREINYNLNNPLSSTLTVGNFSNDFQDVFSSLMAAAQSYTLNENGYSISSYAIAPEGISWDIISRTFNKARQNAVLQDTSSMVQDGNGIRVYSSEIGNEQEVLIRSGGILISKDGQNYQTAIYGGEINTELIKSGKISTAQLTIGNEDESGSLTIENTKITSTDGDNRSVIIAPGQLFVGEDEHDSLSYENGKLNISIHNDVEGIGYNYDFNENGFHISQDDSTQPSTTIDNEGLRIEKTEGAITTVLLQVKKNEIDADNINVHSYLTITNDDEVSPVKSIFQAFISSNGKQRMGVFFG